MKTRTWKRFGKVRFSAVLALWLTAASIILVQNGCKPSEKEPAALASSGDPQSPPSRFRAETEGYLTDARTAQQNGLYAQAAKYVQKALESDSSHTELLHDMGVCYSKAGQPLSAVACIQAYLALCPQVQDRQELLSLVDKFKRGAQIQFEGLIDQSLAGWKKLPGTDSAPAYPVNSPAGKAGQEYEERQQQFSLRMETKTAVWTALMLRGTNHDSIVAFTGDRFHQNLGAGGRLFDDAIGRRITWICKASDFGLLRRLPVLNHANDPHSQLEHYYIKDETYLESKAPELYAALSPARQYFAEGGQDYSVYLRKLDQIFNDYCDQHPVVRASLTDWLSLISKDDPTKDYESSVDDIRTASKYKRMTIPRQLAAKAGEIGEFLWTLEDLERRSNAEVIAPSRL